MESQTLTAEEIKLIREGNKMQAIVSIRRRLELGLLEALELIKNTVIS